jgi:hypothetical protein
LGRAALQAACQAALGMHCTLQLVSRTVGILPELLHPIVQPFLVYMHRALSWAEHGL